MSSNKDVTQREQNIWEIISQLPRRAESEYIIKIEIRKIFGSDCHISLHVPYLYGIIKNVIDYCHSATAIVYTGDENLLYNCPFVPNMS